MKNLTHSATHFLQLNPILTPKEIKKLPFFIPNYDIFWVWKIWNKLLWGKDFKETLDTIIDLNKNAQAQRLFYAETTQEKILSPDDICLQAFSFYHILKVF